MGEQTKRSLKEGLGFGIIAGIIFAAVELLATAMMGKPVLMPLKMSASVVLGAAAIEQTATGGTFILGIIVHLALSAIFGLVYGLINSSLSSATQTAWGRQTAMGVGFGALLWLINFQLIARLLYPWFLPTAQPTQLLLHALFYGLPLALMYAAAERQVHRITGPAPGRA